jgi:hypothetical protein
MGHPQKIPAHPVSPKVWCDENCGPMNLGRRTDGASVPLELRFARAGLHSEAIVFVVGEMAVDAQDFH